jgi:hypothetical protein
MRFVDALLELAGPDDDQPQWIARPDGWDHRGLELYLAGDESGPNDESLARAVRAFAAVAQIEKQGRDLWLATLDGRARLSSHPCVGVSRFRLPSGTWLSGSGHKHIPRFASKATVNGRGLEPRSAS